MQEFDIYTKNKIKEYKKKKRLFEFPDNQEEITQLNSHCEWPWVSDWGHVNLSQDNLPDSGQVLQLAWLEEPKTLSTSSQHLKLPYTCQTLSVSRLVFPLSTCVCTGVTVGMAGRNWPSPIMPPAGAKKHTCPFHALRTEVQKRKQNQEPEGLKRIILLHYLVSGASLDEVFLKNVVESRVQLLPYILDQ